MKPLIFLSNNTVVHFLNYQNNVCAKHGIGHLLRGQTLKTPLKILNGI